MEKYIDEFFPYQEIYRTHSDHQAIQVFEDTITHDKALYLDGRCQFDSGDSYIYHESMGVLPSLYCKDPPVRALILGGGDGLIATELLKIGVTDITLVDIDPEVVRVALEYFPGLNKRSLLSDNVKINYKDAFEFVKKEQKPYDLIILDYTDPLSNFYCQRLYTEEHITDIKKLLKVTGSLSVQVVGPGSKPLPFWSMAKTLASVFPAANMTPLRFYQHRMSVQQGEIILSKSGKFMRNPPNHCKFLDFSAIVSMTSLSKDEYTIDNFDHIPVSTVDNLAYFNLILTPYSRFPEVNDEVS